MAYKTYITEALVCGSTDHASADRSFLLFTREAGMLYAHAKSVRREHSKHRYALQECSHARVTLVRGKTGWKVTGAEPIRNFYTGAETREVRSLLRNVVILLRRVIHGETPHPEIFDDIIKAFERSGEQKPELLETVISLRMLHALGYVAPEPSYEHLLHSPFSEEFLEVMKEADKEACRLTIRKALLESQL